MPRYVEEPDLKAEENIQSLKETVRPKYAHPKKEEAGIFTAPMPECLLPKCRADESLLAEIITKEFADHLHLYRIAEIFGREGIKISRKMLSQWVVKSAMALKPLYQNPCLCLNRFARTISPNDLLMKNPQLIGRAFIENLF